MPTTIIYDVSHMNDIIAKYDEASLILDDIGTNLKQAINDYTNNYTGDALTVVEESITVLCDHVGFLKLCVDSTSSYVADSRDEMVDTDAKAG